MTETSDRPLILFLYANQYADLFGAMARELRDRDGIDSMLVVLDRSMLPNPDVYDFHEDEFVEIVDISKEIAPRPLQKLPKEKALAEAAFKLEQKLGTAVNELIRADRHAGLDFVLGGLYPRSHYGASIGYEQAVDIVLRIAKKTESLIAKRKPIAVVGAPGDIARSTMVAVTEAASIPLRIPGASFSNVCFQWRVNRYYWPANLADNYQRTLEETPFSPEDKMTSSGVPDTDRTQYARRNMEQSVRISTLLKQVYRSLRREAGHIVKRRNLTYGRPLLSDALRMRVQLWFAKRRALKQKPVLDSLENEIPFILYPLAVEPESTLQCESPMCDNQLAIIDLLVKNAPGGWKVVIKEHPGFTTPRPDGFYDRIKQYPNAVLAAPYESGEALASRARAVALAAGSLGLQAALAGVPVIAFSPIWFGRLLPHVLHAYSYDTTRQALMTIAEKRLPPVEERRRTARALISALELGSIPLQSLDIVREQAMGRPVPEADLHAVCDSLIESLSVPVEQTMIPFVHAETLNRGQLTSTAQFGKSRSAAVETIQSQSRR